MNKLHITRAHIGLFLLALAMGLLLAFSANAQLPPYMANPQVQIQRLQYELEQTGIQLRATKARLKTADSVLIETRINLKIAIAEREARIQATEDSCNSQVLHEYTLRTSAESMAYTANLTMANVKNELTKELLTNRFGGWGRKKAIRHILKPLVDIHL